MDMNGILIGSENVERLKDYYTKLFGKPGWDDGGFYGWQLGSGWITIGAHDQVKGKNPDPGRVIWNIVTPDVKGEFEKLKAAGATVVRGPYNPGRAGTERRAGDVDRDVLRPGQQLLPAHEPDGVTSATRALTIFVTSAIGSGLLDGNWMVPLLWT